MSSSVPGCASPGIHMRNWQPHPPPWFRRVVAVEFPKGETYGVYAETGNVMGKKMVNHLTWAYPIFRQPHMNVNFESWMDCGGVATKKNVRFCGWLKGRTPEKTDKLQLARIECLPTKRTRFVNFSGRWRPFALAHLLTLKNQNIVEF